MAIKKNTVGKKFSMRLLPRSVLGSIVVGKKSSIRRHENSRVRGLDGFTVSQSDTTGQLIINGVPESELVNKFPGIEFAKSSIKPKHLTAEQIRRMVAAMKVAS